jgi:hypothetical protein
MTQPIAVGAACPSRLANGATKTMVSAIPSAIRTDQISIGLVNSPR